jgi:hypothetical protein
MKKILLLFSIVFTSTAIAQTISPVVISSAGTTFNDGTSQLDWTLGEPATATFSSGSNLLTQGFHQPNLMITSINNIENTSVSVYPNPTLTFLNVQLSTFENTVIELYSIEGKLLATQLATNNNVQIDMTNYSAGNYLLRVNTAKGKTSSYKISKTN